MACCERPILSVCIVSYREPSDFGVLSMITFSIDLFSSIRFVKTKIPSYWDTSYQSDDHGRCSIPAIELFGVGLHFIRVKGRPVIELVDGRGEECEVGEIHGFAVLGGGDTYGVGIHSRAKEGGLR